MQGKSPFPFALAELVDNSLRALQRQSCPQAGCITLSMVIDRLHNPTQGAWMCVAACAQYASSAGASSDQLACYFSPRQVQLPKLPLSPAQCQACVLTNHELHAGLLSVSDNGVGMTKQELNSWAVMNLSMEDRGLKPQEAEDGPGLGRFLSGNLSFFGVGQPMAVSGVSRWLCAGCT